ncbi:hypothetical protein VZT92_027862 [Zoarces viviparus]|uniref:C-type lectin domain-containing protein n=1 Tax=Zoarces viviparus TaxID=48416 RepID=A0AAW1DWA7_ZOAVI
MAEAEVNYASVVFKSNKQPPPEAKKAEETVYDEVKKKSESTEQTADTNGVLPDKKANSRRRHYQLLACCLGILCVILLLGLIAACYFLATLSRDITELNQLNENNTTLLAANRNLTNLNGKLSVDNDNLRRERSNLTVQLGNLTQNYTVLESKITNLTTQNQELREHNENLTTQNQQLKTEKNILTEQIQTVETNCIELNISRAQWSIDAYCPKTNNVRQCNACQEGWLLNSPSCYVIHDAPPPEQITWEQARANCRGNNADLVVAQNQQEKNVLSGYSWPTPGNIGYWIGLRVEGGRWKWIDGSDLNEPSWIAEPTEGQCAVSVHNQGWKSVMCEEDKRWICTQKALTV